MENGKLFYIVGPSGAGKDSLLQYARKEVKPELVKFARRYITRAADPDGENHVPVSHQEFLRLEEESFFKLWWESHGNLYGVGPEIDRWMKKGFNVVMNGSRGYLPEALKRYPNMYTVLVEVSEAVLRIRLNGRGRETAEAIEQRIQRSRQFQNFQAPNIIRINNDRPLHISGSEFVSIITGRVPAVG